MYDVSIMETVYIETTIVSYLVARLSPDAIVAGHQQTTNWWNSRRGEFECFVFSQVVIDKSSLGDPSETEKTIGGNR